MTVFASLASKLHRTASTGGGLPKSIYTRPGGLELFKTTVITIRKFSTAGCSRGYDTPSMTRISWLAALLLTVLTYALPAAQPAPAILVRAARRLDVVAGKIRTPPDIVVQSGRLASVGGEAPAGADRRSISATSRSCPA